MSHSPWDEFPDSGFLRDSHNENVGRLERRSDGSQWITRYPDNQYVGRYDPSTNMTWDVYGNFVGFGNLLASLLPRR
jgi:hypothetical protein